MGPYISGALFKGVPEFFIEGARPKAENWGPGSWGGAETPISWIWGAL